MPRIVLRSPSGTAFEQQLDKDRITIGRAEECALVVSDAGASRLHADIRREGGIWVANDCGSLNGTLLNGSPLLAPTPLRPGDQLVVGSTILVFEPPPGDLSLPAPARPTLPVRVIRDEPRPEGASVVLVGKSEGIRSALATLHRVAPSDLTVLVTGENGTGKEVVARLIHLHSPRAARPLVVVNCPALSETLLESELFGVEKGVATGVEPRQGILEAADGGTVILDEIADMDPAAQAKVLRFLEDRTIQRVGGRKPIPVDVRVIGATNHDLEAEMIRGNFRRDLFHRLSVVNIHLPPLRERREDIPLLVKHFLSLGRCQCSVSPEAMDLLAAYDFPGNIRELKHAVQHACLLSDEGNILPRDLPRQIQKTAERRARPERAGRVADAIYDRIVRGGESFWDLVHGPYLRRELAREEVRHLVERGYVEAGGSYRKMARHFGMEGDLRKLLNFLYYHELQVSRE